MSNPVRHFTDEHVGRPLPKAPNGLEKLGSDADTESVNVAKQFTWVSNPFSRTRFFPLGYGFVVYDNEPVSAKGPFSGRVALGMEKVSPFPCPSPEDCSEGSLRSLRSYNAPHVGNVVLHKLYSRVL
mgnify:CR=1 FL=1